MFCPHQGSNQWPLVCRERAQPTTPKGWIQPTLVGFFFVFNHMSNTGCKHASLFCIHGKGSALLHVVIFTFMAQPLCRISFNAYNSRPRVTDHHRLSSGCCTILVAPCRTSFYANALFVKHRVILFSYIRGENYHRRVLCNLVKLFRSLLLYTSTLLAP